MRYEMRNFIKFSKSNKPSNVGQKSKRSDVVKRQRKIARLNKQLQRKVAQ